MIDTVEALTVRLHDTLVALLTDGPGGAGAGGLHEVVARASALGPDGAWLVAAGHAGLGGLACVRGLPDQAVHHLDAAVTAGYSDCVALHTPPWRALHADPRFRVAYGRMRVTQADFDELLWLHREMNLMASEARTASVDNVGRLDFGVSLLPRVPLPTREPQTAGVLATRVELAAVQTALQQAALKAEFQRSSGNVALDLVDGTWDHDRARRDAWDADDLDARRQRAAEARAFTARPGAGTTLLPCPPPGSITYPA
ncbi:hypothetical protein GCM10010363_43710 [Streptomyces omiyaensis]|uniref:hypothetical protein n=1 Tax=Streptomyces omiyaensis TaxID=68247 RepID=UPI00167225DF|nr:hypothetical protein [Streptomyces omiyaensis]GGY57670.1 hypothetical protein GCM10010363_43710 [Streptomyces omiyaensis]